jgi:hypothetical protein
VDNERGHWANKMSKRPLPKRILVGRDEGIFSVLPEDLILNFLSETSENALLWNTIYPLTLHGMSLGRFLALRPLSGTSVEPFDSDGYLTPYFWGYGLDGQRLTGLDDALLEVDGPGPKTEVDLFLVGEHDLVLVEAKRMSSLGRCSRYGKKKCPEIHSVADHSCIYWADDSPSFSDVLNFGPRPEPESTTPSCARHYQLARTLLVGLSLARQLKLRLHLWLILPRAGWKSAQLGWIDFVERIQDDVTWNRMRVLAWEDVRDINTGREPR